jgi:flavin reductase (DIM6/NTAB) family NADH-FMN oxidoreductase RutF
MKKENIMPRQPIPVEKLILKPQFAWGELLLTSGDFSTGCYNAMTVGWGSIGVMWDLPFVQVVVRPVRYTYEFMEKFDTFTVCAFPKQYSPALSLLGSKSGRDGDKIAESGLSPIPSNCVAAPNYAQAELVFECKKIYWDDLDKHHFLHPRIAKKYPNEDYHRIYYGEILAVTGEPHYIASIP